MKSHFGRIVCHLIYFLLCLAAIIVGLHAFGYNLFMANFFQTHLVALIRPIQIVFLVAGILGIVYLLKGCKDCGSCDSCKMK